MKAFNHRVPVILTEHFLQILKFFLFTVRVAGPVRLKELLNISVMDKKEYMIFSPIFGNKHITSDSSTPIKFDEDSLNSDQNRDVPNAEMISSSSSNSSRSSCSYNLQLNSTWNECKGQLTHSSSLEDTFSIHSNDWSLETPSNTTQNTPMSLHDELGIISRKRTTSLKNVRFFTFYAIFYTKIM
jgi:hypothetical protein